ncbi:subtilisin family serine protease [Natronospira proteinivora]|uniref:Subtilisin family serine protease n=1 Tax=Natronospira proteinivora TaxID=1807133 RepID=A0ABT1GDC2_9GAMM|nr:S8 family serine peptidase [Natronospira proteinivora]MCP1727942.1 subtilisin family serine protease [Natronospira proteinivora]
MATATASGPTTIPVSEYKGGIGYNVDGELVSPRLSDEKLRAAERGQDPNPGLRELVQNQGDEMMRFIVAFDDPAVSLYTGGIEGFEATSPAVTGESRLQTQGSAVQAYSNYLMGQQDEFLSTLRNELRRDVKVDHQYIRAMNGMAITVTPNEAMKLNRMDGVRYVTPDEVREMDTDQGPGRIGADGVWDNDDAAVANRGEGVVIGIIDSGINPFHTSFDAESPDGYQHVNPMGEGVYLGVCDPSSADYNPDYPCNSKLIGAYDYAGEGGFDVNGHGSHVASTAAGNPTVATMIPFYEPFDVLPEAGTDEPYERNVTGVAPRANLVNYRVCAPGCPVADSVAAVEQSIEDGVDILNFSISGANNPWDEDADPVSDAWAGATHAGIFVAASAGNDGPGAGTVSKAAPWVSSVAANTHDRVLESMVDVTYGPEGEEVNLVGAGFTSAYEEDIIYGGDVGVNDGAFCADTLLGGQVFAPDEFDGEIVLCDLGTDLFGGSLMNAALANVFEAGGGGVLYANTDAIYFIDDDGDETLLDMRAPLPAAHILSTDRAELIEALDGDTLPGSIGLASISEEVDEAFGGQMANFSSRGPITSDPVLADLLKPDISAPGQGILAAYAGATEDVDEYDAIGGTSMSSPHVAGAAALVMAGRPDWTPMEVKSALMLTAYALEGYDWYDQGAGEARVGAAVDAGLVLDESIANMIGNDPHEFGNIRTLNLASMANRDCLASCSWTRTFKATRAGTYSFEGMTVQGDVEVSVEPAELTLEAGQQAAITVTMAGAGLVGEGPTNFGRVMITDHNGGPDMAMPIAAEPDDSVDLVDASFDTGLMGSYGIAHTLRGGNVWVADRELYQGSDHIHGFNFDGSPTESSISTKPYADGDDGDWTAGMTYDPESGMLWHLNVGGDQCLHEVDPSEGEATGNAICLDQEDLEDGRLRGVAYDQSSELLYFGDRGGWIYEVNLDGEVLNSVDTGYAIGGLAVNPATGSIFITDYQRDTSADVFVHDLNDGYAFVDEIVYADEAGERVLLDTVRDVTIDCDGTIWATNQITGMAHGINRSYARGACTTNLLNLAGIEVSGGVGNPTVVTLDGIDGTLTAGATLDITYTATGGDWLDEFRMHLTSPEGTEVLIGGAAGATGADPDEELDYDLGWASGGGTDSAEELLEEFAGEEAAGEWTVELYSTWDGSAVAGVIDAGGLVLEGLGDEIELMSVDGQAIDEESVELTMTANTFGATPSGYFIDGDGEQTEGFELMASFYPQTYTEVVDGLECGASYDFQGEIAASAGDITSEAFSVSTAACVDDEDEDVAEPSGPSGSSFFSCSMGSGKGPIDPLMPTLFLLALLGLAARRRV